MASALWDYFTKDPDYTLTKIARCNTCSIRVKTSGNSTNLASHLLRHHRELHALYEAGVAEKKAIEAAKRAETQQRAGASTSSVPRVTTPTSSSSNASTSSASTSLASTPDRCEPLPQTTGII